MNLLRPPLLCLYVHYIRACLHRRTPGWPHHRHWIMQPPEQQTVAKQMQLENIRPRVTVSSSSFEEESIYNFLDLFYLELFFFRIFWARGIFKLFLFPYFLAHSYLGSTPYLPPSPPPPPPRTASESQHQPIEDTHHTQWHI